MSVSELSSQHEREFERGRTAIVLNFSGSGRNCHWRFLYVLFPYEAPGHSPIFLENLPFLKSIRKSCKSPRWPRVKSPGKILHFTIYLSKFELSLSPADVRPAKSPLPESIRVIFRTYICFMEYIGSLSNGEIKRVLRIAQNGQHRWLFNINRDIKDGKLRAPFLTKSHKIE